VNSSFFAFSFFQTPTMSECSSSSSPMKKRKCEPKHESKYESKHESKCAICHDNTGLEPGIRPHLLPCGHISHRKCLREMVKYMLMPQCPECRHPFRKRFVAHAAKKLLGMTIIEYKKAFREKHDNTQLFFAEDEALDKLNKFSYDLATMMNMQKSWVECETFEAAERQLLRFKKARRRFRNIADGETTFMVRVGIQPDDEFGCDFILGSGFHCDVLVNKKTEYHCSKHANEL